MFPFSSQRHFPSARGQTARNRKFKSRKPTLEMLEDRTVPSTMSPLAPKSPLGSLVYESTGTGQISVANPSDSFTLDLDAGQTLSVAIVPYMFNGHWYIATTNALDWNQAEAEAVELGGHLVTINSQAEQDFINNTFLSGQQETRKYWTGLNDEAVEGVYVWVSGEPVSYTNWFPGEPSNGGGVEDYVAINYHHASGIGDPGLWNDEPVGGAFGAAYGIIELSGPTLQPSVTITGPEGPLTPPPDAAPGDEVLLNDIPVASAGTYTISVTGFGGSTGRFQAHILVNGAFEGETINGSDNGNQASALDLDGSFRPIAAGRHSALLGKLPLNRGNTLFSDDFERTELGAGWSTYSSLSTGRIQLTDQYADIIGGKSLIMDDSKAKGSPGLNEAIWTVNLAGQTQAALSFRHANWNDEVTAFAGPFTGHANADGIAISADGINWYPAWTPPSQSAGVWFPYTIDLAAIAVQNGISLGSNFQIKFQQYGAEPLTKDGRGWDKLQILVPDPSSTANEDWYKFTLAANESTTVTVTPQGSGKAHIQIFDANGLKLFDGDSTPTNVGEAITFTAPTAGSYYARVSGNDFYSTSGVDYLLTVTKSGTFDLEYNSGSKPWLVSESSQVLVGGSAVGSIQPDVGIEFVQAGSGGMQSTSGVAFRDGKLYVGSYNTNEVLRFDATTGAYLDVFVTAGSGGIKNPGTLQFGADGNLYVSGVGSGGVYRYSGSTGAFIDVFTTGASITNPEGFAWGPDGNFYLSARGNNQILQYNGSTGQFIKVFATGSLNGPLGVTFGPDNKLYISNHLGNSVTRYDGSTGSFLDIFVNSTSGGLHNPHQLLFGEDGTLYVASADNDEIRRYDGTTGVFINAFGSGGPLDRPVNMVFGPDGSLYVAGFNSDNVIRYNGTSDFYRVTLNAGEVFLAQTITPFDGPNSPTNSLDPVLRLYDNNGTLLETDDNGMSDHRNARLWYQASSNGEYYIEIGAAGGTVGEYGLNTAIHPQGSPLLVIDNISVLEGNSGTTNAQFTVTLLKPPPSGDVTVDYTTADGTALAGSDYTATSGTLTFTEGGATSQTITVLVNGDLEVEAHEHFVVQLTNPSAGIALAFGGQASATILNEDTALSISAPTLSNGAGSDHYYTVTSARLSWQDAEAEAVALGGHLVTINNQAEQDFLNAAFFSNPNGPIRYWIGLNDAAVEGTFVWSSGEPVTYTNWQPNEPNNLNNGDYAVMYVPPTGWNDGSATEMYYGIVELPNPTGDIAVFEGDSGTHYSTLSVTLSAASALPVSVQYATADGSATATSNDYVPVPLTTVTFAPGETVKFISVFINGDTTLEPDETFVVNLSNASTGVTISDGQGVGTILTDDTVGSASDMYVWDIGYETRQRGSKTDVRLLVTARSDSDADGVAEATDAVVSGASVTVQLSGPANATLSGTTNSSGQFISSWINNVSNGTYVAEVTDLQASSLTWNKNLDPTGNDTDLDNDNLPDQQFVIGSALQANTLGSSPSAQTLSKDQFQPLVQEALSRYVATGADLSALNNLTIQITDLPGATLGLASGNTIYLDANAAGWGWFVDPTPHDDLEFMLPGNQGEQGRMDLLTVIMHEMGHVLGQDHEDHGVMQETLSAGQRYSLEGLAYQTPAPTATGNWLSQQYYLDSMYATLASEGGNLISKK